MPTTTPLAPEDLDRAAAALYDTAAWQQIVTGWPLTAPEPALRTATESTEGTQPPNSAPAGRTFTHPLLTKTVDELTIEATAHLEHGRRNPIDIRLPGRLTRALPDWTHHRRPDLSHPPSTQLLVSAQILRDWGWQNRPHHLRDIRGRRCLCGAICTTVALGVGSIHAAHQAAGFVLAELRHRGWPHLIGDWNQVPGRTAGQAIEILTAAHSRAAAAGR